WPGDALKVVTQKTVKPNTWHHVFITYDGSSSTNGVKIYLDGVLEPVHIENNSLKTTTRTKVPLLIGQRSYGERVIGAAMQDVRIYGRTLTALEISQLVKTPGLGDLLTKPAEKRTPKEVDDVYEWWLTTLDKPFQAANEAVAKLVSEETTIKSRGTIAHVMNEKPSMPEAFVLNRGDYDKRKEKVVADVPKALPAIDPQLPKNRLGFAQWLLRKDHPLTSRVTVNRFWQELYGQGLVRTSGDFGITGDLPSHPELLDWLALEFQSHYDVKRFFKMLVTSQAYRQSAATTKEKQDKDPFNRLVSRGPRFRMDAEMVRDYALATSGLLVRKLGGPSVKPYQPEGVWEAVAMIGSNTRDYKQDSGEKLYRRSMYTFWKRAAPPASMEVLNAPNRETCAVKRERTNTPLQALLTLNDVQYVEAARVLAEKILKEQTKDAERLTMLGERVLARPFRPEEATILNATLADLRKHYAQKPGDAKQLIAFGESKVDANLPPVDLAAWTILCNQVLNLDEVLNK
ncbi:MAG: DUF1553 domain-containing protein, partial [Gemmataceae bacterium]